MDFHQLEPEVLSLAAEIQQIPAPTGCEQLRARFMADQFTNLGLLEVHIDSAGNTLGFLKGGASKPLIISAHLDTVHDLNIPLPLIVNGTKIIGPGIGDNSLAVASLIGLARYMLESKTQLPGGIWFAANVGEEGLGNLRGMIEIVQRFGNQALAYLVVEGLGLGQVYHRGLGVKRYRISLNTPGGHSWENYGTPSAIHELAQLVNSITAIPLPLNPRTSLNVGTIKGGTTINSIASHAALELDLRSESQEILTDLANQVNVLTESVVTEIVQAEILNIGDRPSGEISSDHPLVLLAADSLKKLGISTVPGIASTDSNIPLSRGFPSICIGLTHGGKMHTLDEYIETKPFHLGFQQLCKIATQVWDYL